MNGLQMAANGDHSIIVRYRGSSMDQRVPVIEVGINEALLAPNIEDTYVCMTLGVPGIVSDKVIIDHGLYVDIDVMNNDRFSNQSNVKNLYVGPYVENIVEFSKDAPGTFSNKFIKVGSYEGTYGTMELRSDDMLRYQLSSMNMTAHDKFCYAVEYQIGDDIYYYYAAVTVIPATTIYFEENFSDAISFQQKEDGNTTNGWSPAGTVVIDGQDMDRVTLTDEDLGIVYGYDSHYNGKYQFGMGGAQKTNVYTYKDANNNILRQKTAKAVFRFTGTGFDVISMTSNRTGTILVSVFKLDANGNRIDKYPDAENPTVDPERAVMVDTYYGYTLNNKGEWVVDPSADTALYQIPVINVYGLEHGTYEVEIYAAYNSFFGHDQYTTMEDGEKVVEPKFDFYLDGIRIYDPVEDPSAVIIDTEKVTDAEGNEITQNITIEDVYLHHGEADPTYHELRDELLPTDDAASIEALVREISLLDINIRCEEDAAKRQQLQYQRNVKKNQLIDYISGSFADAGAVYIDSGKGSLTIGDMGFYGPNNEVYLNKGGAIVTTLNYSAGQSVYLGLKSIKGGEGIVEIYECTKLIKTIRVSSASDMFYDITGTTNVTIKNASTNEAVIAITNVKVGNGNGGAVESVDLFGMDTEHLSAALLMLTGEDLTGIEPATEPQLSLQYPSLSFEDEVFYNVYFTVGDMTDVVEMGLMLLPSMMADGTVDDAVAMVPGYLTNGSVYMVRTDGIPAAQMGDTVYFKVYAKLSDGTYAYSAAGGYNAKAYAKTILNGEYADAMKSLVVSMLRYGAEAQKFFGHNVDALMDAALTEEQKALIGAYDESMMDAIVKADSAKTAHFVRDNSNFKDLYPSVSFDGAFAINYYCALAIPVDGDMTLYWWSAEDYAACDQLTLENASGSMTMESGDKYWGQVAGIAAKDMDKTWYVSCVFESEGETVTSGIISYSLGAYCQGKAAAEGDAQQAFAQATAVYGYYAKQYFAQD